VFVTQLRDEAIAAGEGANRCFDAGLGEEAGLQRVAHGVRAIETLPQGKVAALVEFAAFHFIGGEMRRHRHAESLAGLADIEFEEARNSCASANGGEVGIVPAAGSSREGVECCADNFIADGKGHQHVVARSTDPFAHGDDRGGHVAGVARIALADIEVIVVVAAQQRAVDEAGKVRIGTHGGTPDQRAIRAGEGRREFARNVRSLMVECAQCHCDAVAKSALGRIDHLQAQVARNVYRKVGKALGHLVTISKFASRGHLVSNLTILDIDFRREPPRRKALLQSPTAIE
jgi:hypothetical protein